MQKTLTEALSEGLLAIVREGRNTLALRKLRRELSKIAALLTPAAGHRDYFFGGDKIRDRKIATHFLFAKKTCHNDAALLGVLIEESAPGLWKNSGYIEQLYNLGGDKEELSGKFINRGFSVLLSPGGTQGESSLNLVDYMTIACRRHKMLAPEILDKGLLLYAATKEENRHFTRNLLPLLAELCRGDLEMKARLINQGLSRSPKDYELLPFLAEAAADSPARDAVKPRAAVSLANLAWGDRDKGYSVMFSAEEEEPRQTFSHLPHRYVCMATQRGGDREPIFTLEHRFVGTAEELLKRLESRPEEMPSERLKLFVKAARETLAKPELLPSPEEALRSRIAPQGQMAACKS